MRASHFGLPRPGLAASVLALILLATPSYAYKPPRWYVVVLSPALIDKAIACWPAMSEASDQVAAKVPGTTKADATERRRLMAAETERVLTACGFPDEPGWRSTSRSILLARGRRGGQPPSGTLDERGNEVTGATEAKIRAGNRRLVARYKAQLDPLLRRLGYEE